MFRTKQFISTTNIVLASLIGLGMIVGFQGDEAEADHSSWICNILFHHSFGLPLEWRDTIVDTHYEVTNCYSCPDLPPNLS